MRKVLRAFCPWIVVVVCAAAAGCGGHSTTPTAPSSSTPASPASSPAPTPAPAAQGATINGTIASGSASPARAFAASGGVPGVIVTVSGTSLSSTSDAAGNFSIANVPAGDVVLTFVAPGVSASAAVGSVGASESLHVDVSVAGSVATVDSQQKTAADNSVDADGAIADLNASSRQFRLGSAVVTVPATAAITRNGAVAAFGDLHNGDRAHVRGLKDGSEVRASQVDAQGAAPTPPPTPAPPPPPTPTPPPTTEVTLTGTVSAFSGTCPAVNFTVQGAAVTTVSSTVFDGTKGCTGMANGDAVTVVGKQSGGTVLASKVTNATSTAADVYVNGPIVGLSGTCPSIAFTLGGTKVKTSSATTFNGRACAELKNGDAIYAAGPQQADGTIMANRTFYTATAVTLTGTVSNLGGAWPVFTLTVQGTAVRTSSATVCDGTKGCSLMANGDSVTVTGAQQSDGSVLAAKITNATAPPPADVTLNGPIAGLSGACPSLSMTVDGKPAKTNASTLFNAAACVDLRNGDTVYAIGPKQSDGSVLASKVYWVSNPTVTISGVAASVSGTCPAIALTIGGTPVKATSATTFDGTKGCTQLVNGDSVTVTGTKQSDGTVLATKVTNAAAPPLYGTIANLTGTCPVVSLSLSGTLVKTTASTTFTYGACADLKNGAGLYAVGTKQSDGSLLASQIYFQK